MIPETHCFNAVFGQEFFPLSIALDSFRQTMLRTVEFNAQPGVGAIEIQNVITNGMFPAEFEAGETMAAQWPP